MEKPIYDREKNTLTIETKTIKIPKNITVAMHGSQKEAYIYMLNIEDYKGQRAEFVLKDGNDIDQTIEQIELWLENENS